MKSLRPGFGGKAPNVPLSRSDQRKSSQGAKRYLTVSFLTARLHLRLGSGLATQPRLFSYTLGFKRR